jgi:hypothetical protein
LITPYVVSPSTVGCALKSVLLRFLPFIRRKKIFYVQENGWLTPSGLLFASSVMNA